MMFMVMTPNLEDYIGKSINEFPNAVLMNVENESNTKVYAIDEMFSFMEKPCSYLHIETDTNDIIQSVSFILNKKMDRNMFDLLVNRYGNPIDMFKMGEVIERQEASHSKFKSTTIKGGALACSFEEDPMFIVWKKTRFEVVVQKHPDNAHVMVKYRSI